MIDLHYTATPNGQKIAIMLEETGHPYRVIPYDIFNGDQLAPAFGLINPNYKLPAIVDHGGGEGAEIAVFESGAILQYLAEKSGQFLPPTGAARASVLSWLTWQVAGLGPMGGQASHFMRYAPAGQDYAIDRYKRELGRLLAVLEHRLSTNDYVGGTEYSIADMAIFPGRAAAATIGMNVGDYPATSRWVERIRSRPAVARAMTRADLVPPAKYMGAKQVLDDEEWSNMFGDAMHAASRRKPG
jgi:GSH-dependent disulfide-bond oxidoreductase